MSIELRTMRYVIAIAEAGGFQRAAEQLHMSEPPLSRQIRELERELGVALFHRRPTRPTAQGHVFIRHAKSILADVERAVAETRTGEGEVAGRVRLGCGPLSGSTDVPQLVAAVADRHPAVAVEVVELWDTELSVALLNGDIDIAMGWHLRPGGDAARRVLRCEPYVLVVACEHPMAPRGRAALSDLRGETFRFLPRRFAPGYYDAVLAALGSTGVDFPVWESPLPGLRYFGGLTTGGFNMLPRSFATSLPSGLRCLDIIDDIPPAELHIAWQAGAGRAVEAVAALATRAGRQSATADQ